ncbi:MAG: cobalt ECF transporter T component CbiQ [Thermoflexales bacterium]|nr:cobalt ECF transporter T component CbiQ [Thermoflexales bacterium]
MHVHFLDPYRARPSPIHQLDPRVKLVLALAFILALALAPVGAWPAYVLFLSISISVQILSELGIGYVLKRALLALPFALAALPILFTTEGVKLVTLPAGPWTLMITLEGVERLASIMLKAWLSVQMAIVLTASTAFPDLLLAMRAIKIPRLLVAIVGLMWRYLFVLVDEALRLMRAREARSGSRTMANRKSQIANRNRVGGSLGWRARVAGGMAGNLFLRSFDRAERIYAAMAARGYDGEVRALPLPPLALGQRLVVGGGLVLLSALVVVGHLL